MIPLLAIPIIQQTASSSSSYLNLSFFQQPFDVIFYEIFLFFGWIPIAMTLAWGFIEMWVNYKQGIYASKLKFVLLAIDVPSQTEQTPKALENLFANLYGAKSSPNWKEKWILGKFGSTFSFEIISQDGYIQFLIRTETRFRDIIEAGIYAHYPDAEIYEVEDYTKKFPQKYPNAEYDMWGGEMTLDGPSYIPIRTYVDFEDTMTGEIKDPLGYTLEQIAKMRPGEQFWIQYLVQPSSHDWVKEGNKRINQLYGIAEKKPKGVFEQMMTTVFDIPNGVIQHITNVNVLGMIFPGSAAPAEDPFKAFKLSVRDTEEAKAILKKTQKIGMAVKIRLLYVAKKQAFAKGERATIVKGILNQFSNLNLNKFGMFGPSVPKDDYFWLRWSYATKQNALMGAYCSRSFGVGADPKFLNAEELATLWHFPTISMKAPLIKKSESKRAEPPVGLPFTFEENTLPDYGNDLQKDIPTLPPTPSYFPTTGIDFGSSSGDQRLADIEIPSELLPELVAPTFPKVSDFQLDDDLPVVPQAEIDRSTTPELSSTSDFMPPSELLPNMPSLASSDEEEDLVPPNLPT